MGLLVLRSSIAVAQPDPEPEPGEVFPIGVHESGRYFVQADGTPWPMLARSYWAAIGLSVSARNEAVADLKAKGFNAFEFRSPNATPQDNFEPFDGDGNLPFTTKIGGGAYTGDLQTSPDFATVNEPYFAFLDDFIEYCEAQEVALLYFPLYMGVTEAEGWSAVMVDNGTTKCQNFGAFIANRYKDRKNILWCLGGDIGTASNPFTQDEEDCLAAFITGLKGVANQQSVQYLAEWHNNSYGPEQDPFGPELTAHSSYSFDGRCAEFARLGYGASPTKPSVMIEEPYDEEGSDGTNKNPNAVQPCRKFIFRGVIDGCTAGYCNGNGYLIHFFSGYEDHFDTETQLSLAAFNSWWKALEWWRLVPHGFTGAGTLITAGRGTIDTNGYVTGAITPEGDLAVFYAGPSFTSFTVDMSKMAGSTTAVWIDPASGATSSAGGPFANSGTQTFSDPGNNSGGDGDWFLKLTA